MLGRLMKHEIKACGRMLLPFYGVTILMAVISALFLMLPERGIADISFLNFFAVIFTLFYAIIIIADIIMSFVMTLLRFKKNIFEHEGYLTNTLPVSESANIGAKLIVAVAYQILGIITAVISGILFVLIFSGVGKMDWNIVQRAFAELFARFSAADLALYAVEGILVGLASFAAWNLMIYAAMAVGHSCSSHKVISSVGAYIAMYFIMQIINFTGLLLIRKLFPEITVTNSHIVLMGLFVYEAAYSVVYFFVTRYFIKNRLNLQ